MTIKEWIEKFKLLRIDGQVSDADPDWSPASLTKGIDVADHPETQIYRNENKTCWVAIRPDGFVLQTEKLKFRGDPGKSYNELDSIVV